MKTIYILSAFLSFLFVGTQAQGVTSGDSLALVALYDSTNGAGWTNKDNWLIGTVDTWHGVTVSGGRVTSLDLGYNLLNGALPVDIGNLDSLTYLRFIGNEINGSIPPEIGNLSKLTFLDLGDNQLSGSIPFELGNLTSLTNLTLNTNQLTGSIPAELGNLTSLTQLIFSNNQLTDSIPIELGNLTSLTNLLFSNNNLTGSVPVELGNLTSLIYLHLNMNQLSGAIPTELKNLTALEHLILNNNKFTDLPDLSTLTSLLSFSVYNNYFTFEDLEQNSSVITSSVNQLTFGTAQNIEVGAGSSINLSPPLPGSGASDVYQWQKDNSNITGADSTILALTNAQSSDAGNYKLTVTNPTFPDVTLVSEIITVAVDSSGNTTNVCDSATVAMLGTNSTPSAPYWFTYSSGADTIDITVSSVGTTTSDTYLKIYDSCGGTLLGSSDDYSELQSQLELQLLPNQTIKILWDSIYSKAGFDWNLKLTEPSLSNTCDSAVVAVEGTNNSPGAPYWFTYSAGADPINVTISSVGTTTTDTYLKVYDSCGGTLLGSNDDYNELQSELQLQLSSNQIIKILWDSIYSKAGFDWNLKINNFNTNVCDSATVAVEGTNNTPIAPYWFTYTAGADTVDLTISSVGATTTNTYLKVFSSCGDTTLLGENDDYSRSLQSQLQLQLLPNETVKILWDSIYSIGGFDWTLSSFPVHSSLEGDSLALVALYNSTDGANWTNNTNWLSDSLKNWHGVTVAGGRVSVVNLESNNLIGPIPLEIRNLDSLQELTLSINGLTGSIPVEVAELRNLLKLDLSFNQLTGPIPPELGNIITLNNLSLSGNDLTGSLPIELANLINLNVLYLLETQVTGSIPPEYGNLTNLTTLGIGANSIGPLRGVTYPLSGSIPAELGNLINLRMLILGENNLTGTIPIELGNLTNLNYLCLQGNKLEGTVPIEIANLSLSTLSLNGNYLNDLPDLTGITVTNFDVTDNYFTFEDLEPNAGVITTNTGQKPFGNSQNLNPPAGSSMTLNPPLPGAGVNDIYQWEKDAVNISGATADTLTIDSISTADYGTYVLKVTNSLFPDLTLTSNTINVQSSDLISDSLALVDLYNATDGPNWSLNTNWLTGNLNTWFGVSVNANGRVDTLSLERNNLNGYIPTSIGNLTELVVLSLERRNGNNNISGSLPYEIGNLSSLREFYAVGMNLEGTIPASLFDLPNITRIEIPNNNFTELPEIDTAYAIQNNILSWLELSGNYLTFEDYQRFDNRNNVQGYILGSSPLIPTYDSILTEGSSITLTFQIGGTGNTYQWLKNGAPISGATSDTLTIINFTLADQGNYVLEASNSDVPEINLNSDGFFLGLEGADLPQGPEWSNAYSFGGAKQTKTTAIEVDGDGNILVFGDFNGSFDFLGQTIAEADSGSFLAKMDKDYNLLSLINIIGGYSNSFGIGDAMAYDKPSGDTYLAGIFVDSLTIGEYKIMSSDPGLKNEFVAKINVNGEAVWIREYPLGIEINDLSVKNGELVVSGLYTNSVTLEGKALSYQGDYDFFIAKYKSDTTGMTNLFVKSGGGSSGEYLAITAIDNNGNIYATAEATSDTLIHEDGTRFPMNEGDGNVLVIKYDTNGVIIWEKIYSGSSTSYGDYRSWPTAITIDPMDNPVIIGWFGIKSGFDVDTLTSPYRYNKFITQLASDGTVNWARSVLEEIYGYAYNELETDSQGNIYFMCERRGDIYIDNFKYHLQGIVDAYVIKYSNNGDPSWIKQAASVDMASGLNGMGVAAEDHLYIGGRFNSSNFSLGSHTLSSAGVNHGFISSIGSGSNYTSSDSLALVELYNSTDGAKWSNNTNWLTGPLSTWYGITVTEGRITGVKLNNNLLTGDVPVEITNLVNLDTFLIQNNDLNQLQDLSSLSTLAAFDVSNNYFTFEDLEPNDSIITANTGQKPFGVAQTVYASEGSSVNLNPSLPGKGLNDTYQWVKNGTAVTGATADILSINNVDITDYGTYVLNVTNSSFPDLTLISQNIKLTSPPVSEADSLALVALYNSTEGFNWTNNENWLSGKVNTWYGITVDNTGRVSAIDLSSNRVNGVVPSDIDTMAALTVLNLSNNSISDLAFDPTIISLQTVSLENNLLDFADLAPFSNITTFTYSPQDSVGQSMNVVLEAGASFSILGEGGAPSSAYSWYKDEVLLDNSTSELAFSKLNSSDQGNYRYEVNDPNLSNLTLHSRIVNLEVLSIEIDSLALVAIYNATGGASWANNTNWLSAPVDTWHGVTVANKKVISVVLDDNNLSGEIPEDVGKLFNMTKLSLSNNQITMIADSLASLVNLDTLILAGNQLEQLPVGLDTIGINVLALENNMLDFNDLQGYQVTSNVTYSPQALVGNEVDTLINQGETVAFPASGGLSSSNYQWFKDAAQLAGETNDTLAITNLDFSNDGIYTYQVTDNLLPALTLMSRNFSLKISSLERDSLALVALYNATGGSSWNNNTNWLTANLSSGWFGVTIENNRVVSISLADNNLSGNIPVEVVDLTGVHTLNLQSNKITDLPDLSALTQITSFNVSGNLLKFGSLEANAGITGIIYSPQNNLSEVFIDTIAVHSNYVMFDSTSGSANNYQWFYKKNPIDGATAKNYEIVDITRANMGDYHVQVTNNIVTDLTLTSYTKSILAFGNISGLVDDDNGSLISEGGEMILLRVTETGAYDTISSAATNNPVYIQPDGSYTINNVVLFNYVLVAVADTIPYPDHLPTYYKKSIFWEEADTIMLIDNISNLNMTVVIYQEESLGGEGEIFGFVEEETGDSGGKAVARKRVRGAGISVRRGRKAGRTKLIENSRILEETELIGYGKTSKDGEFSFTGLLDDVYYLNIQYPGYPMDSTSFIEIPIGNATGGRTQSHKDKVEVEALVAEGKITVRQINVTSVYLNEEYENMMVYPNPATDFLTISFGKYNTEGLIIKLFNSKGSEVNVTKIIENNKATLNLQSLNHGIYILNVYDENKNEIVGAFKVAVSN